MSINLLGAPDEWNWDDIISCCIYGNKATADVAPGQYLAVGLPRGPSCSNYCSVTLQLNGTLVHGESIRCLAFGATSGSPIAYGAKKISFWGGRRVCLCTKTVKHTRHHFRSVSAQRKMSLWCSEKTVRSTTVLLRTGLAGPSSPCSTVSIRGQKRTTAGFFLGHRRHRFRCLRSTHLRS